MVLAIRRRKFGLKKEATARDPLLREGQQSLPHQGFLVMDQLVGRIDGCEARRHSLLYQLRRRLFFPRRAIHEERNQHIVIGSQGHAVFSKINTHLMFARRTVGCVMKQQGNWRLLSLSGRDHVLGAMSSSNRSISSILAAGRGANATACEVFHVRGYFRTAIPWGSAVSFPSFIFVMATWPL